MYNWRRLRSHKQRPQSRPLRPHRLPPRPRFPFPLELLLILPVLLLVMRKQRIQIRRLARLDIIRRPGTEDPVASSTLARCLALAIPSPPSIRDKSAPNDRLNLSM